MNNLKALTLHTVEQTLSPDTDKEQWLAYLTLKVKYPNLTCQSHNGYHCEGIADYKKGVRWQYDKIVDLADKSVIVETKPFHSLSTSEVVNTWMKVMGETQTTKRSWLRSLWGFV